MTQTAANTGCIRTCTYKICTDYATTKFHDLWGNTPLIESEKYSSKTSCTKPTVYATVLKIKCIHS